MDFSTLYLTVFPVLGGFFGKLSALSLMPFGNIGKILSTYYSVVDVVVPYTNVFTGVSSEMIFGAYGLDVGNPLNGLSWLFSKVSSLLWNFITAGVPSETPLIFGLLIFIAESFFIIVGVRFIVSMFRGF